MKLEIENIIKPYKVEEIKNDNEDNKDEDKIKDNKDEIIHVKLVVNYFQVNIH